MNTTPRRPDAPDHAPTPTGSPIFDDLVSEQGDVLAESRDVAQATQEEAAEALDWSDLTVEDLPDGR